MRRFLIILGCLFLAAIVLLTALVGYTAFNGAKYDASSKAYMDKNIPVILSTCSKDELRKRASAELLQTATDEKIDRLFSRLKELGKLQQYGGSKGGSRISLTTQNGKLITADYAASAIFQNGAAEIKVRLIQKDGQWQILDFFVDSPIFEK
jgi:hypothetical protein